MKWAVEQVYFDSGLMRVRMRKAEKGEKAKREERTRSDIYVDIFRSKDAASAFARECRELATARHAN